MIMTRQKLFYLIVGLALLCYASLALSQDAPGQSMEIRTQLKSFTGKPSWLIIVRDMDTGEIKPLLFDFENNDNTWVQIIYARHFRIIESTMNFGPPPCAKILNFCHLQDGILANKSFFIQLSGKLTPNRYTSTCNVMKYKNYTFPIAERPSENTTDVTESQSDAGVPAVPASPEATNSNQQKPAPAGAENIISQVADSANIASSISKLLPQ